MLYTFCSFTPGFHREIILEKQLTGHRVDRSICAWFWEQSLSQGDSFKVPSDLIFLWILLFFQFYILISGDWIFYFQVLFKVKLWQWAYLKLRFLVIHGRYSGFLCSWLDFHSLFFHLFLAAASNCFSNTLSFPNCSRGDHFLGLHPSWNATSNGNWGKFLM